ncbi:hypothetical protein [Thermus scotoductus]|uniref:hypothetical protein n=1 Tax=Thermus scotoductus TaxID=37636 RepID=UPI0015628882|nr:hypothetical protein [Thermus scotoductus]
MLREGHTPRTQGHIRLTTTPLWRAALRARAALGRGRSTLLPALLRQGILELKL